MRVRSTRRGVTFSGTALPPAVYAGDFTTGVLPAGMVFTRTSSASRINALGVREIVGIDVPRFDYDPITLACRGLLIENAGVVNGVRQSEDLTSGGYTKAGVTVTANSITRTTTTGTGYVSQAVGNPCPVGSSCSLSMRVKQKSAGGKFGMRIQGSYPDRADALFDLTTGVLIGSAGVNSTVLSASIVPDGDGWYRVSLSCIPGNTSAATIVFGPARTGQGLVAGSWEGGDATGTVFVDCYCDQRQFEVALAPSSYLPTTTANVSRSVDSCSLPIAAFLPDAETATVLVDFDVPPVLGQVPGIFKMRSNSVAGLAVGFYIDNSTRRPFMKIIDGVAANIETNINAQAVSLGTLGRLGLTWSKSNICGAIRGSTLIRPAKNPGWTSGAMTDILIGTFDTAIGTCVRKITIWDKAVSPQQLSAMTLT